MLLDFPKDIQLAATAPQPAQQPERVNVRPLRGVPRAKLVEAVDLIRRAKRPVFYGGGGLINAGPAACEAFTQLVRRTGAPCTLTLMGLGAFPASDKQFLGMLGMHGTLEANLAMHHADLVVCIGARFDDRVTAKLADFCPEAKKIHVDVDACSINKLVRVDVPIVGDCAQVVPDLVDVLGDTPLDPRRLEAWWETIALWRDRDSLGFEDRDDVIVPQRILRSLNERLLGRDAIVATDVGQHQMWAAQHLGFDAPRRWLTSGGAGTMGYGLPAAIGAQIAHPDKPVVCVSGDASLLMNLQELSTAMQHRTPVKLIVVNNGRMGMVRQWQDLIHGGRQSHSWTEALPDFVAVAKGFGWASRRVESPAELEAALDECLASDGPFLLDVVVPTGENCFPMIPPGRGHHELVLNEEEYRALP